MKTYTHINKPILRPKCSRAELLSDQDRLSRWLAVNTEHSNCVHVAKSLGRINRELRLATSLEYVSLE